MADLSDLEKTEITYQLRIVYSIWGPRRWSPGLRAYTRETLNKVGIPPGVLQQLHDLGLTQIISEEGTDWYLWLSPNPWVSYLRERLATNDQSDEEVVRQRDWVELGWKAFELLLFYVRGCGMVHPVELVRLLSRRLGLPLVYPFPRPIIDLFLCWNQERQFADLLHEEPHESASTFRERIQRSMAL